jgi:dTDP-4-amino-4,6-dideoxygalactose transaminase
VASLADVRAVPFSPPSIGAEEIDAVVATLRSGWLSTGPRVREFEEQFAAFVGARHTVAVNSGTAALHLSLVAAGVGPGEEVVTTPLTFCATANAVIHVGATPVFADVDPATWNLGPDAAAAALTPRTRAVLPVHFAGRPVDGLGFRALTARHGLLLIEDAAHAVEAIGNAGKIGSVADFTAFSFYATKNLTTGEGGMVTTGSDAWAERLRIASLHGMSRDAWARYSGEGTPHYDVVMAGFKYNMMDIQAAIGLRQLARLAAMYERRTAIWRAYDAAFRSLPLGRPSAPQPGTVHARHLYTVLVDKSACGRTRDELAASLKARGVATSVHFRALHLHRFYAERFNLRRGMFPHAERISDRTLSLPLSAAMSDEDVDRVIDAVIGACR